LRNNTIRDRDSTCTNTVPTCFVIQRRTDLCSSSSAPARVCLLPFRAKLGVNVNHGSDEGPRETSQRTWCGQRERESSCVRLSFLGSRAFVCGIRGCGPRPDVGLTCRYGPSAYANEGSRVRVRLRWLIGQEQGIMLSGACVTRKRTVHVSFLV
jgi:hypothetical protein